MIGSLHDLEPDYRALVVVSETGCWEWQGAISSEGYGHLRKRYVHRVTCEQFNGPIPAGYQVDHLCRNRRCVNPAHLEAVTPRENILRSNHPSAVAVRTGLCKRGHSLADHGAPRKNGSRYCKACRRDQQRALYLRQDTPWAINRKRGIS